MKWLFIDNSIKYKYKKVFELFITQCNTDIGNGLNYL